MSPGILPINDLFPFFDLIATWEYVDEWSECSVTCGGGEQNRTQSCVNSDNIEGQCSGNAASDSRDCNVDSCRKLFTSSDIT